MNEEAGRARIVLEAQLWLGTPYHDEGRVKGAGVDCAMLLAEVFPAAGLITKFEVDHYSRQWHLNRKAERYLSVVKQYAHEIEGPPLPGDIVMYKFGRCFSHGGIVVKWPMIIHAYIGKGCVLEDAEAAAWLTHVGEGDGKARPKKFFSYW